MKVKQETLINELIEITQECKLQAEKLNQLAIQQLNNKKNEDNWSALEAIEHLNRYGDFYIPEIGEKIKSSPIKNSTDFKSGKLGNYFAKSMKPKEKLNKMKTFKSMNTLGSELDKKTIETFINQQDKIIQLLTDSRLKNLTKIKTNISISKFIKLRLGDTFRVVVYHNQRHIAQANKAVKE